MCRGETAVSGRSRNIVTRWHAGGCRGRDAVARSCQPSCSEGVGKGDIQKDSKAKSTKSVFLLQDRTISRLQLSVSNNVVESR